MKNAFGHIPEDLLQQAQEAWDFKVCERSDGTTYGTSGNCAQKGSKEIKGGSDKSSWDDSNLAAKMGAERSQIASKIIMEHGTAMVKYAYGTMPLRGAKDLCKKGVGDSLGIDCAGISNLSDTPTPLPKAAAPRKAPASKPSSSGGSKIDAIKAKARAKLAEKQSGGGGSKIDAIKAKAKARLKKQQGGGSSAPASSGNAKIDAIRAKAKARLKNL